MGENVKAHYVTQQIKTFLKILVRTLLPLSPVLLTQGDFSITERLKSYILNIFIWKCAINRFLET